MANNRYFLYCDCGQAFYMGKSLGEGIYDGYSKDEMHDWMWEHMMHKEAPKHLTPEWFGGEVFKVLTEYDERINYGKDIFYKPQEQDNGKRD